LVAVTAAGVYPVALPVEVAKPVLEASAVMVTFWATSQLDDVEVSVLREPTGRPVLPGARLTVTVTFEVGAAESVTLKVPVESCAADRFVGVATMTGRVLGGCM
jgi:hypothetical protein